MANPKFIHEEIIEEESIKYSDLPSEIRYDIQEFEELKNEYNESPSEAGFSELTRESVKIADDIQNWIELNYPDDEENFVDKDVNKNTGFVASWKFW